MKKGNILKQFLSLSLIMLLLFLSCDERTPVAADPPTLSYRLSLFVSNPNKDCSDVDESGNILPECDETLAYAASNALDQLEITALLEIDNESDGVFDGGHQNQNITFSWTKSSDGDDIDMGFLQVNEGFIVSSDETNIGETNVNGIVEGVLMDELALGDFDVKAT